MRSKWKYRDTNWFSFKFLNKIKKKKLNGLLIFNSNCFILDFFVNSILYVYNGFRLVPLHITESMVGLKIIYFIKTKKIGLIHNRNLKNNKKIKKKK